jgi:hypothetical protein
MIIGKGCGWNLVIWQLFYQWTVSMKGLEPGGQAYPKLTFPPFSMITIL